MLGNKRAPFSNAWKVGRYFFQTLENKLQILTAFVRFSQLQENF